LSTGPHAGLRPLIGIGFQKAPSLTWWLIAFVLCLCLGLAWPFEILRWGLLGVFALSALLLALSSPKGSTQALALFVFTGILTSLDLGFSFKAPQLFALLAIAGMSIRKLLGWRNQTKWPWSWILPFFWILLAWLPSLTMAEATHLALDQNMTGIRLIFNYLLLLLSAVVLFASINKKNDLTQITQLLLWSCALSLGAGWLQQIGFYTGIYNPLDYIGKHSSLVDFYGPFLRLSPGTFANEYGEILQTVGILLMGLLYLSPERIQGKKRFWMHFLLAWVVASLVINFTRASWLVFVTGAFFLLALGRPPLWRLSLLGGMFYGIFAGLFRLSQIISETGLLLTVGQRFGELSDISADSAGQRLDTWALAWQEFLSSPWIGKGLGRFVATHNVPLQLLAETGLVGCLVFYGVMAWITYTLFKAWRLAEDSLLKDLQITWLVAFLGCLAFDLTNHGIFHFVLWVCIGLGLATARLNFEQFNTGKTDAQH
jgi:O-antigen ligase